jgi:hypothetical protein
MLGNMVGPGKGPVLFTGRCIEMQLFFPDIDIFFQVPAQVHAVVIQAGVRVFHSFTIKNNFLHSLALNS